MSKRLKNKLSNKLWYFQKTIFSFASSAIIPAILVVSLGHIQYALAEKANEESIFSDNVRKGIDGAIDKFPSLVPSVIPKCAAKTPEDKSCLQEMQEGVQSKLKEYGAKVESSIQSSKDTIKGYLPSPPDLSKIKASVTNFSDTLQKPVQGGVTIEVTSPSPLEGPGIIDPYKFGIDYPTNASPTSASPWPGSGSNNQVPADILKQVNSITGSINNRAQSEWLTLTNSNTQANEALSHTQADIEKYNSEAQRIVEQYNQEMTQRLKTIIAEGGKEIYRQSQIASTKAKQSSNNAKSTNYIPNSNCDNLRAQLKTNLGTIVSVQQNREHNFNRMKLVDEINMSCK
jgi:hypothetical protein